jgi:hypothetical protein
MIYRSRGEPKLLRDRRRKRPVDANDRLFVRHGFETRLGGKERNVTAATDLDRARHQVENAAWLNALARVGLVAKGASFALVGILASKLAVESGGKATSRQGALQSLAQHSFGKFLLILLAVGFAAYALWRFAQTFFVALTAQVRIAPAAIRMRLTPVPIMVRPPQEAFVSGLSVALV